MTKGSKSTKFTKLSKQQRSALRRKEEEKLDLLQKRVDEIEGTSEFSQFEELPISEATIQGLKESSFLTATDIQKKAIPYALKGEDVLATAKTGSGKTLAFLVPAIESLVRQKITEYDGLAALIVSPTRELAVQIFQVLSKIGKHHQFSAGLVTGGKDVKYEKERVSRMNILVGTPGRLSQHLNEAVGMETGNLQVLVLDEADRCLDMGFKLQIDNIIGHLPPTRQTLLFSATQNENIRDLARLSLTNPKRIGISSDSEITTPESLDQYYVKIALPDKLDVLWSFIKSHLKSKILVFFSSSKQVQYTYETFRKLQPGISLLKLYGRHKQTSRLETTMKFSQAQHACLFATDIVARGLDFPAIDWVIQVDCPEDVATYVHRVGRSARLGREGKSLLMLLPSEEEGFLKRLQVNHIELKLMNVKSKSKKTIKPQLQSLCFKDPMLKNLGQRAFISYYRSVYLQSDKDVFKVEELPIEGFAASLGLPGVPKIKIKGGIANKEKKNQSRKLQLIETGDETKSKIRTKYDRMFERQNQTVLSQHYLNMTGNTAEKDDNDDDDDFMKLKRKDHKLSEQEMTDLNVITSKRQAKKALSKKASLTNKGNATKLIFDDDGEAHPMYELEDEEDFMKDGDAKVQKQLYVKKETEYMDHADVDDKLTAKAKRDENKRRRKERERLAREEQFSDEENYQVNLDDDLEPYEPKTKKQKVKWFETTEEKVDDIIEVEEPETLQDLETLTNQLINS